MLRILRNERLQPGCDPADVKLEEEDVMCPVCRCDLYDGLLGAEAEPLLSASHERMLKGEEEIDVVLFGECMPHFYHRECAEMMRGENEHVRCAVCSKVYGVLTGDMPRGTMRWQHHRKGQLPLEGLEEFGTFQISYSFPCGVKKDGRTAYRGTNRSAYLPDSPEGIEVLALLVKAFRRRLSFTVGFSVTTGRDNVVVWNSIHHKTCTSGGTLCYGYPDPTYFNRVKLELADKGVFIED